MLDLVQIAYSSILFYFFRVCDLFLLVFVYLWCLFRSVWNWAMGFLLHIFLLLFLTHSVFLPITNKYRHFATFFDFLKPLWHKIFFFLMIIVQIFWQKLQMMLLYFCLLLLTEFLTVAFYCWDGVQLRAFFVDYFFWTVRNFSF